MNPRAELQAIRERADKASEHIGRLCTKEDRWTMSVPVRDDDSDVMLTQITDTDMPRLLDAVEKVLELHKPMGATDEVFCSACFDPDWTSPDDNNYPCPTVRAITTALEGK